jgi:hypothetical protein
MLVINWTYECEKWETMACLPPPTPAFLEWEMHPLFLLILLHLIFGDKRSKNSLKEIKNNTFKKKYFHFGSSGKNILESNLLKTFYRGCLFVLVKSLTGPEKFSKILLLHQKLFKLFIWTDTLSDTRPSIHIWTSEKILCPLWYLSLHYIRFTHSVREG